MLYVHTQRKLMESIKFNLHSQGNSRHKIGFRSISSNIKYLFDTSQPYEAKIVSHSTILLIQKSIHMIIYLVIGETWPQWKDSYVLWVRIGMGHEKLWEDIWNSDERNGIRTFFCVSLDLDWILKLLFVGLVWWCNCDDIGIRNVM
jgi:hypothetical protein